MDKKSVMIGFRPGKKTLKPAYTKVIIKICDLEMPWILTGTLKENIENGSFKEETGTDQKCSA